MSTLKIRALTTAILLAATMSQPALAASRSHFAETPQAGDIDQVRRDYDNYYGIPAYNAYGQGEVGAYRGDVGSSYRGAPVYPSHNLPYPDRPYGDPDRD